MKAVSTKVQPSYIDLKHFRQIYFFKSCLGASGGFRGGLGVLGAQNEALQKRKQKLRKKKEKKKKKQQNKNKTKKKRGRLRKRNSKRNTISPERFL